MYFMCVVSGVCCFGDVCCVGGVMFFGGTSSGGGRELWGRVFLECACVFWKSVLEVGARVMEVSSGSGRGCSGSRLWKWARVFC